VCRRAVARFSLLQQLLLLLLANTAAGCLLTSTESCCHWQSAPYLTFLNLLICPDIIAVAQLLPLFTPTCILTETRTVKAAFRLERQLQR
jgi:hypothetical protein